MKTTGSLPWGAVAAGMGGGGFYFGGIMEERLPGDPTPQQIRQLCWKIQDSWTEAERRKRAGCYAEQSPTIPHMSNQDARFALSGVHSADG